MEVGGVWRVERPRKPWEQVAKEDMKDLGLVMQTALVHWRVLEEPIAMKTRQPVLAGLAKLSIEYDDEIIPHEVNNLEVRHC